MATARGFDVRRLLVDAAAVVAVAALLVGVHVLVPAGVRAGFALDYADPDPFHALTAAYVHLTDAHLRSNVAGFLAGAVWAGLVARLAGEPRWFRLSLLWYLTVLPVLVGMTAASLVGGPVTSRGFSSVVAGLAGFGLVGVGVVLHRAYGLERRLAWNVVAALGVVVAAEILWLVVGRFSRPAAGLVVLGVALTLLPLARAGVRSGLPTGRAGWLRVGGAVVMTVLLAALVGVFVVGLFPAELAREDAFTNVLGHYLGLVYGAVIAGWGYRYWSVPAGRGPGNRRS